ncbi:hypothetical protein Hanom_Chr01g00038291 [Helianthus anomalus]
MILFVSRVGISSVSIGIETVLVSKILVWSYSVSIHDGKNRNQLITENAKSQYRIDIENLLVREIRYCYSVSFAHT